MEKAMKKILTLTAISAFTLPFAAMAQDAPAQQQPAPHQHEGMHCEHSENGKMKCCSENEDGEKQCHMMDRSQMDHSQMKHGSMEHRQMNHGQMNRGEMDHGHMDHGDDGDAPQDTSHANHQQHGQKSPE